MRPPPGPEMPGRAEAGPGCSLQHAVASAPGPMMSASSKVTMSSPSFLNAGEPVMRGTHADRKASMLAPAVAAPPSLTHGASCPSLHRFGVMKLRLGVVATDARSVASPVVPFGAVGGNAPVADPSGTTLALHSAVSSMIEWK